MHNCNGNNRFGYENDRFGYKNNRFGYENNRFGYENNRFCDQHLCDRKQCLNKTYE
ncbi:hypothetical protein [Nostoc sp.]|uniref:hypothetical protein n=1 Tax=Nostoc sp. TaxID=1180 RepID=UPI002FF5AB91